MTRAPRTSSSYRCSGTPAGSGRGMPRGGTTSGELAARYSEQTARTLAQFHAPPDECICPTRDASYRAAVGERFRKLVRDGRFEARELTTWFCAGCDLSLYDSFVAGTCPHCGARCNGFLCEACYAPKLS